MRPILSTVGSFNYSMSQWLVPKLASLCVNEFVVKDSFAFVEEILNRDDTNYFMASFDITSLFTNIPVVETSNLILDKLFPQSDSVFENFDRISFSKVLQNCLSNNIFLFNKQLYVQKDGAPMGGCVSPTLANVFLCHHEVAWLTDCPSEFKPVLYRRYVDDTFLLFKSLSHIDLFFQYINNKHPRIKFTFEVEKNNSLSFLDVLITKIDNKFTTDVYRKPTFSGMGMKFCSSVDYKYKVNLISCLLGRAFKICSNYNTLNFEIDRLRKYFCQNSFPVSLFESNVHLKFDNFYNPKTAISTVSKEILFCKIPFLNDHTNLLLRKELRDLLSRFYPQIDLRIIFENNWSIGSFFSYKDKVPKLVCSNVVYKYSCAQCSATYIGESSRHLKTRICEHRNLSPRTGELYRTACKSNIFKHFLETDHEVLPCNFEILHSAQNENIFVIESIFIHQLKPSLNGNSYSTPLAILN